MTDRTDRSSSDEPDGTPAYAASLRPPGESVQPGNIHEASDDEIAEDAAPAGNNPIADRPGSRVPRGAGYDVRSVSGDTDLVRPDE
jgi:hypothetical protein